ncbi:MAG: LysR family transcriptional regulator [Pseudomonadota bacterium]
MTFDQLQILIAVAEGGSLGAASRSLNKTQPTLSVGLKNLEEELGVELFDRSGYRMKLTGVGQQILQSAKKAVADVSLIQEQASGFAAGRETEISIGLDYLCPLPILLSLLRRFSRTLEGTRLSLKFGVLAETENWLSSGDIDLALTPFLAKRSAYQISFLCDLDILPVVNPQLLQAADIDDLGFLQIPQIVVKTKGDDDERAPFAGLSESPRWWVSDHMVKKQLIQSGFGWGHLEASSISEELKGKQLVELENKYVRKTQLPLHLARRAKGGKGLVSNELWTYMQEEFQYAQ